MSVYLTSLTGSVVALSFVAQASEFSDSFFIFALALLPVGLAYLRHQWSIIIMRVAKALPM